MMKEKRKLSATAIQGRIDWLKSKDEETHDSERALLGHMRNG